MPDARPQVHPCSPQRSLLAEGTLCRVEMCSCGTIHVSFGPVTLRLRPEAVESIWGTLGDALGAFYRPRSAARATSRPAEDAAEETPVNSTKVMVS